VGSWRESWGSWGSQRGRWNGGASYGDRTGNLQADPWLRGSSDCRVGQAPMQAVHGCSGGRLHSPSSIPQRRRLPPPRQLTSGQANAPSSSWAFIFAFSFLTTRYIGHRVLWMHQFLVGKRYKSELSLQPTGRWPAVEVPISRLVPAPLDITSLWSPTSFTSH
jgi:hypothetical protein